VTDDARRLRVGRAEAQLLRGDAGATPEKLVHHLLAVQAQDFHAARLALRVRRPGLTAVDVDQALTMERSLVIGWLVRGTLHLVRREDYPWLLALSAPRQHTTSTRRLRQEGVPPAAAERATALFARALTAAGPLDRHQLAARAAAAGIRTEGQALVHLLHLAALRGVLVLGPVRAGAPIFAATNDWLGVDIAAQVRNVDRDAALAELARRFLAAHGPASAHDLAAWSGLGLRAARAGLGAIGAELTELADGLVDRARRSPSTAVVPARLLPAFDPYLLGWKDRSFAVPARWARKVHPGGGVLRATATVDGSAVGTWTARRRDDRLHIDIDGFASLDEHAGALRDEAADVARFEGLT
jgi:hypothetical protein